MQVKVFIEKNTFCRKVKTIQFFVNEINECGVGINLKATIIHSNVDFTNICI